MIGALSAESLVLHIGEKNADRGRENFSVMAGAAIRREGVVPDAAGILLVEDNPADVLLLREALASNEIEAEIQVARDGEEAIRLIDAIDESQLPCPDLIVIDLNLPRRSGFEVLARVRASWKCGKKPAVILSSSTAVADRERAANLGASTYIRKPSSLKEFLSIGGRLKTLL